MYKDIDLGHNWCVYEEESIKLRPSRLEQVVLPSVFHTEEYKILRQRKVDATIADHLVSRGQTRSRKMQDLHLM
jgi:hypothetical protein